MLILSCNGLRDMFHLPITNYVDSNKAPGCCNLDESLPHTAVRTILNHCITLQTQKQHMIRLLCLTFKQMTTTVNDLAK